MLWKAKNVTISSKLCDVFADFSDSSAKNSLVEQTSQNAYVRTCDGLKNVREGDRGMLVCAPARAKVVDATVFGALNLPDGGIVYCTNSATIFKPKKGASVAGDFVCETPALLHCAKLGITLVSQIDDATYALKEGAWQEVADFGFDVMAWHRERVFGADGSQKVFFTACDDPTDWSGEITFPCKICAVAACGDKLFAVGESIFEVDFDDKTQNTKIVEVFANVGKVFGKTVAAVGETLYFLTSDGLFCYKNGKLASIPLNMAPNSQNADACAAVTEGKYWISFAESGSKACDTVVELAAAAASSASGVTVPSVLCYHNIATSYLAGGERLLFDVDTRPHTFASGHTNFTWTSRPYDFGTQKKKFLRKLMIKTSGSVDVTVVAYGANGGGESSDSTSSSNSASDTNLWGTGVAKTYHFVGSDALQEAQIYGAFKSLRLQVKSLDNAKVSALGITAAM